MVSISGGFFIIFSFCFFVFEFVCLRTVKAGHNGVLLVVVGGGTNMHH